MEFSENSRGSLSLQYVQISNAETLADVRRVDAMHESEFKPLQHVDLVEVPRRMEQPFLELPCQVWRRWWPVFGHVHPRGLVPLETWVSVSPLL